MSLFESFTGPKWQHSNPQVRRHAVAELDDPGILLELVKTDPDPGVRAAALSHIDDPESLDELIETLPPDLQQQARAQRLAQLLPAPGHLENVHDDATLVRIATLTDQPELMAEAVGRIGSTELRMELACSHPVASVRLSAASGIRDIGLLGTLMQRARGHDKGVYRHCKSVLDEHHARQLAETQQQEKIERLIEQARELADSAESPEYASRCRGLELQWQLLADHARAGQQQRFSSELARCAARLDQQAMARAQYAAAAGEAREKRAAADQALANLLSELEQLDASSALPEDREAIRQLGAVLDDLETRFGAAASVSPPLPEQEEALRKLLGHWRNIMACSKTLLDRQPQLNKLLDLAEHADASDYQAVQKLIERAKSLATALPWPETMHARQPATLTRLHLLLTQLQGQLETLEKNQGKYAARAQALLDTARSELDQQHTREADRAISKARRTLQSLAPAPRRRFEQDMKPLAAQLHEVHEWLGFAIEPKKVELCARIRALVESTEDAETLAVKIKSLQEEWKQLGALPDAREQALWLEFKAAADEAWKPCKAAFAQRAAVHRRNLAARMQLVEQLADYDQKMAWPGVPSEPAATIEPAGTPARAKPDWRMVQKTLDSARAAFAEIRPLDQSGERKSQKALRTVCDRIYHHIQQEYERNITLKEQLRARAAELAASEDLHTAIEQCKKIQREWKQVGITPVAVDRRLWKEFRAACDAVFARLDAQRLQDQAALSTRLKEAEGLRDQARALLDSLGEDQGVALDKTLAGLKQQLGALALPLAVQQRLSRDFQAIEKQARDRAGTLRARREKASWTKLLDTIRACARKAVDAEAAAPPWQGPEELPKGIDAGLLEAFRQQGPASAEPDAANEAQLREACIALEVLAETESPAEDRAARMQYQMRRLAAGMGSRRAVPVKSRTDHINAFIALRPSGQWAERFCNTLQKMPG